MVVVVIGCRGSGGVINLMRFTVRNLFRLIHFIIVADLVAVVFERCDW